MVSCRSSAVCRRSRSQAVRSTMGSSSLGQGADPGPGQGGHPARLAAHPHPVDLVGALLQQGLGDLGVAPRRQAQAPAGEGHQLVEVVEAEPVLVLPVLAVHLQAGGAEGGHGVAGARAGRAVQVVEPPPQRGQADQRVPLGQLGHHPAAGVAGQGPGERGQVGHVVEDVVADDHVGRADPAGHLRPAALDPLGRHPALPGRGQERRHHGRRLVHRHQPPGRPGQGQAGRAPAGADVQDGAPGGQEPGRLQVRRGRRPRPGPPRPATGTAPPGTPTATRAPRPGSPRGSPSRRAARATAPGRRVPARPWAAGYPVPAAAGAAAA